MSGRGSRRSMDRIVVSGEASMGMESACKPGAMAMHHVAPLICAIHRLHSISAESLVDVGIINSTNLYGHIDVGESSSAESAGKKLSKSRFVRKMTSSFRFRRGTPRLTVTVKKVLEEVEDEGEDGIRAVSTSGSRSVPHSPHAEGARLPIIKRRPLPCECCCFVQMFLRMSCFRRFPSIDLLLHVIFCTKKIRVGVLLELNKFLTFASVWHTR